MSNRGQAMRMMAMVAAVMLAGCDRKAAILEREYEQATLPADRCLIARKVADAYLERSSAKKYQEWSNVRDINCLYAETIR